jgi:hypothetical protein
MAHVLFIAGFSEDRVLRSKIRRAFSVAAARVQIGPAQDASEAVHVFLSKPKKTLPSNWEYRGQDGDGLHVYKWPYGSHEESDIVKRVRELLATP